MKPFLRSIAAAALVAALSPLPARPATDTGTVTVTATVADACYVSSPTLAFGVYDSLVANVAAPLLATTTLTVSCTGGTPWSIGLGDGVYAAGTTRQMKHATGTTYLTYELFRDAARTQRWGDAVTTERYVGTALAATGSTTLTIYGRIPQAQTPNAGAYSDTVVATIYF